MIPSSRISESNNRFESLHRQIEEADRAFESIKKTQQNQEKTENTPNPKNLDSKDLIENKNSSSISPLQTRFRVKKDEDILETNETKTPKSARALSKKSRSAKSADKNVIDLRKSKAPSQLADQNENANQKERKGINKFFLCCW